MANKKLYTFKFKPEFHQHLREQAKRREISLTEYIERGMAKISKYKVKDLV